MSLADGKGDCTGRIESEDDGGPVQTLTVDDLEIGGDLLTMGEVDDVLVGEEGTGVGGLAGIFTTGGGDLGLRTLLAESVDDVRDAGGLGPGRTGDALACAGEVGVGASFSECIDDARDIAGDLTDFKDAELWVRDVVARMRSRCFSSFWDAHSCRDFINCSDCSSKFEVCRGGMPGA